MAYNATYSSDDLSEGVISGLTKFVITIAGFAALIALGALYVWVKRRA